MKYNSFYDEQNTDSVIQFNNVHSIGTTIVSDIVGVENNYIRDDKSDTELITSKDANVINAIDIDWNGANVDLLGKNTVLNTSGQLLGFYKDSINTSYDLANSAYNLADEVKSQLSSLSGLTQEQIQQINNLLKKNVLTALRHKSGDTAKRTPVLADGTIILQELSYTGYIPVDIKFTDTSVDFGISYNSLKHDNTIDIHPRTGEISVNEAWLSNYIENKTSGLTGQIHVYDSNNIGGWTNNIKFTGYIDTSYIPVYSFINSIGDELKLGINKSDIPSTNYTAGDSYIIINNNEISVNASELISYNNLADKNYVDTKGINSITGNKGINVTDPTGTHNFIVSMVLNDDQFVINSYTGELNLSKPDKNSYLKFVDDNNKKLVVDIDAVKAYIGNSGQGQTITVDSELSDTSTNPVQNKVINSQITNINSQITNINTDLNNNYVKVDGETTGSLPVIHGNTINVSNVTTDGNDIYVSSDRRLKDNILDITDGEVERLFETESGNMHYFEWKESHKPSFGFIAQELIHFAPETVTQDSDYMQVNYNAAITKTCAALFKKIKQLEKRIKILEGES